MHDLVTIGRFSGLTHLSIKALRLYDKLGVLRPALVDFSSGYRYYGLDHLEVARRIHLLRSLDMPLDEIRSVLNEQTQEGVQAKLAFHRQRIQERITNYQNALPLLEALDQWCASMQTPTSAEHQGKVYQCSFCRKQAAEVRRMIAGPDGAMICNECVDECNRLLAEHESSP